MKRIYKCIFILLGVFISGGSLFAQQCATVTVEAYPMNPQTGIYNYFGVRVTLAAPSQDDDVVVTGFIHPDVDPGSNQVPFTVTVYKGEVVGETGANHFQTDPTGGAAVTVTSISHCPGEITALYAGVYITFETSNNILRFNSESDLNAVLDQLDLDYENHNTTYDNNYDTSLTSDQMDSIDLITGFDEFSPFRVFENLFSGFVSKRMEVENTENTWLNNAFTGTDPDDVDLTFDDAENTIFNDSYSFKVGNDLYQLTSLGLYVNGVLDGSGGSSRINTRKTNDLLASTEHLFSSPFNANEATPDGAAHIGGPFIAGEDDNVALEEMFWNDCKTSKRKSGFQIYGNDRYKLKVAINTIRARSSAKGKVVHFKLKNGNWKRKRAKMAVYNGGNIYALNCSLLFQFSERKPVNGWKKRRQLKLVRRQYGTLWKTKSGELVASFDTPVGHSGGIALTW